MAKEQQIDNYSKSENASISLTRDDLQQLIESIRKPVVTDEELAIKERAARNRRRLQEEQRLKIENDNLNQSYCAHTRDNHTSRIAWMDFFHAAIQRYVREGYCQGCNKHFKPGVEGYEKALSIPTGMNGIIQ